MRNRARAVSCATALVGVLGIALETAMAFRSSTSGEPPEEGQSKSEQGQPPTEEERQPAEEAEAQETEPPSAEELRRAAEAAAAGSEEPEPQASAEPAGQDKYRWCV